MRGQIGGVDIRYLYRAQHVVCATPVGRGVDEGIDDVLVDPRRFVEDEVGSKEHVEAAMTS